MPKAALETATPQQRPARSWRLLLVGIAMLIAILQLLVYHLSPDAPMRTGGQRPAALERTQQMLTFNDRALATAANGRNVELHFPTGPIRLANAVAFTETYFSGVYSLYPQRVWIGRDDAIINDHAELFAADVPAPVDWLARHNTAAVVTIAPPAAAGEGPVVQVQRLP